MTIPPWLRRHLIATDRLEIDGTTRTIRRRACKQCGAPTLVGLDADLCATTATVDPTPLTPATELAAILTGRSTYRLNAYGPTTAELDRRTDFEIRGTPPTDTIVVLPDHRCGMLLAPYPQPPVPKMEDASDDVPPF